MNVAFVAVVIVFCILFFFYCVNVLLPDFDASTIAAEAEAAAAQAQQAQPTAPESG